MYVVCFNGWKVIQFIQIPFKYLSRITIDDEIRMHVTQLQSSQYLQRVEAELPSNTKMEMYPASSKLPSNPPPRMLARLWATTKLVNDRNEVDWGGVGSSVGVRSNNTTVLHFEKGWY